MHFEEIFAAIKELKRAMPALFTGVEVQAAFDERRPAIGDWEAEVLERQLHIEFAHLARFKPGTKGSE